MARSVYDEMINLENDVSKQGQRHSISKTKSRKILVGNQGNPLNCRLKAASTNSYQKIYLRTNIYLNTYVSVLQGYFKGLFTFVLILKLTN